MVTDHLTDRLGLEPILSINVNLMVTVTETGMEAVCANGPLEYKNLFFAYFKEM